jgi:inosine/xanthosine triphosphatase
MNPIHIAVGSTRRPKLLAVEEAVASFKDKLCAGVAPTVRGYEVESGVGHTPVSREELIRGARQRAEALCKMLRDSREPADFFVGLEGGLDLVMENGIRRVFLQSWAYVSDGARGYCGCSGSVELPEALAKEVLVRKTELAAAIDRFAGEVGVRDGQGAWGVLTGNLLTRQESFRLAVVAGFAPFYNRNMYRSGKAAGS